VTTHIEAACPLSQQQNPEPRCRLHYACFKGGNHEEEERERGKKTQNAKLLRE